MSDPTHPQDTVSLQRQVLQRFREAMHADNDISAPVERVIWSALEAGDIDRKTVVARVMEEITGASEP